MCVCVCVSIYKDVTCLRAGVPAGAGRHGRSRRAVYCLSDSLHEPGRLCPRLLSHQWEKVRKQFHCLPIEWRICRYGLNLPPWPVKPCTLVAHRIFLTSLQHHEPTRSLCSSSSHQLSVLHHNLTFGSRAFQFSTLRVWTSLPVSICAVSYTHLTLPTKRIV